MDELGRAVQQLTMRAAECTQSSQGTPLATIQPGAPDEHLCAPRITVDGGMISLTAGATERTTGHSHPRGAIVAICISAAVIAAALIATRLYSAAQRRWHRARNKDMLPVAPAEMGVESHGNEAAGDAMVWVEVGAWSEAGARSEVSSRVWSDANSRTQLTWKAQINEGDAMSRASMTGDEDGTWPSSTGPTARKAGWRLQKEKKFTQRWAHLPLEGNDDWVSVL